MKTKITTKKPHDEIKQKKTFFNFIYCMWTNDMVK